MPYRDGTGPNSQGPMTGRAMGNCCGDETRVNFAGRGRDYQGCGRRNRRRSDRHPGRNHRFVSCESYDSVESYNNKSYIEQTIKFLSDRLAFFKKRLVELED